MQGLTDLLGMRVFERVVSLGSLTAAAEDLGLSLGAVSKRLTNFEQRLGTQLIHRSTRKLSVSDEGRTLYQHIRRILDEVDEAEESLRNQKSQLSGSLKITVPTSFGQRHLLPALSEFSQRYPQIRLQLLFSDELKDLIEEGIDVAIRYGELPDSRLVARKLLTNRRVLCASPDYLQQFGYPTSIDDLVKHRCIVMGHHVETEWRFAEHKVHIHGYMACNDGEACHRLALQGVGVVMKSYWDVAGDLNSGRLVQVLPQFAIIEAPINLVYLRSQDLAPRVKMFVEYLVSEMAELDRQPLLSGQSLGD